MKVVAFNGSPNKEGNTFRLLSIVAGELEKEGIEVEIIHIGSKLLHGCMGCRKCAQMQNQCCIITKDDMNLWISKAVAADGLLFGSPTYFANVTTQMKALIDRMGYVCKANGGLLRGKVAAPVVAVRRAGALPVIDAINHFLLISEAVIPGSTYWNFAIGRNPGDVDTDAEGINTMHTLGQNFASLMKKINHV